MPVPLLSTEEALKNMLSKSNSYWPQYFAFYSSWLGGIIKDPGPLLLVPADDHMVHRGDGVFEAIKAQDRKIFQLQAHIERLFESAEKISLKHSYTAALIQEIVIQTLKVADQSHCVIRLFLSRGPGAFSANPYDAISAQLYVIITALNSVSKNKIANGVQVGRSQIAVKEPTLAQIKSCNYLPNVLMKKESVDRNLDFTVSFTEKKFLAESATENMMIVDAEGILCHPPLAGILKGTTMTRAMELAKATELKTAIREISEKDILSAQEVMMAGTTIDLLPVVSFEGHPIANGQVGPLCIKLRELLLDDMRLGTPF